MKTVKQQSDVQYVQGDIRYVQGDVVLRLIQELPEGLTKLESESPTTKILQQSEVTGHHHHFQVDAPVEMYTSARNIEALSKLDFTTITPNEGKYIRVLEDTPLYHGRGFEKNPALNKTGDHKVIQLRKGIYEVDIVRVYDARTKQVKRVID